MGTTNELPAFYKDLLDRTRGILVEIRRLLQPLDEWSRANYTTDNELPPDLAAREREVAALVAKTEQAFGLRVVAVPEASPLTQRLALMRGCLEAIENKAYREQADAKMAALEREPGRYKEIMGYMLANPGVQYHEAEAKVLYGT